jgi:hypothetical protein
MPQKFRAPKVKKYNGQTDPKIWLVTTNFWRYRIASPCIKRKSDAIGVHYCIEKELDAIVIYVNAIGMIYHNDFEQEMQ